MKELKKKWRKIAKYLAGESIKKDTDRAFIEDLEDISTIKNIWSISKLTETYDQIDTAEALEKVKMKAGISSPAVKPRYKYILQYAAVLILIAGFVWLGYFYLNKTGYHTLKNQAHLASTHILPDSSTVILNYNAQISYKKKFNEHREVHLSGEAIFRVQHDIKNPFIVNTKFSRINVLGTTFNVKVNEDEQLTRVSVKEGKVRLSPRLSGTALHDTILYRGLVGIHSKQKQEITIQDSLNNENDFAWYTNKMNFHKTPMHEVKNVIQSAYHVKIIFANDQISKLKLNAAFENEELEVLLEVISRTFDISYQQKDDTIIFSENSY